MGEGQGGEEEEAPKVELGAERARGEQVGELVLKGVATGVHDISDGGLLVAIAEMGLAGRVGAELDSLTTAEAFGEDQGRYIVPTAPDAVIDGALRIGTVGGTSVAGVALDALRTAHEGFFPVLMNGQSAFRRTARLQWQAAQSG